ncbi:MAG: hypothetical protein JRE64_01940 [Deltaproteobacteria bacterium]|nr:hypothetical protein [Deltaproteobacteria bacterium]
MSSVQVRPGEIISSELMNFILEKLEDLENQVSSLGQLNKVRITGFNPSEGAPVGEFIQVEGANFLHPPIENLILVAGKTVEEFSSPSTSSILTFRVPESIAITDEEEPVIVSISNEEFGGTEATYTLYPAATGETPVIDTVVTEAGSTILNTDETAIINGENFASNPLNNDITFEIVVAGEVIRYTVADGDIDVPNSNEQKIQLKVPVIIEIPINQPRPVTLKVKVGQKTGIKAGVMIRRLSN